MNFILRGLLILKEKVGKALILFFIMLTVCIVMLSSFAIQSGADGAAILAREKLGAEVTVSQNMSNMMNKQREERELSETPERIKMERVYVPIEYAEILSKNEHVLGYVATSTTTANLTELLAVGAEEEETSVMAKDPQGEMVGPEIGGGKQMMGHGDVSISGVNDYLMSEEYVNGEVELVEGREISEEDLDRQVVMIESTFAEENDLSIGDKFSIESVTFGNIPTEGSEDTTEETKTIEVEVVGIYTSYEEVSSMGFKDTSSLPYNRIIAPYTLVSELNDVEDTTKAIDSLKFYIDDPINVDEFVEFAEGLDIDLETYSVDAGNKEYESMMAPIENISSFSKTTIVIVTVFGGVILALIIMLSIKSRITEIGMLMALGEKRLKIVGQFLTEAIVTLVIAFGISIVLGGVISDKVADVLLENELTAETSYSSSSKEGGILGFNEGAMERPTGGNMPGGFRGEKETVEKISELDVSISSENVIDMGLLSLIVVLLATILPSIIIMRYNPKKILSNHS